MDQFWFEILLTLAAGIGLAAAAGLRVFLPMLVLGLSVRAGWLPVDSDFAWLSSTAGLSMLAVASLAEVAGYYIPAVDNLLDAVAGPAAFVAGIFMLAAVATDLPPFLRWAIAIAAGGGTAGAIQGLTTLARLKSTGLTGGVINPVLSTVELVGSVLVAVLAVLAPLVGVALVLGIFLVLKRLTRRILRPAPVETGQP